MPEIYSPIAAKQTRHLARYHSKQEKKDKEEKQNWNMYEATNSQLNTHNS